MAEWALAPLLGVPAAAYPAVQIDDLGLYGNFYLQACRCTSSKTDGDKTTLTLRMPDLLSAAFGELPNPPIYRAYSVGGGPST